MSVHATVSTEIKNQQVLDRTCKHFGRAASRVVSDHYVGSGQKCSGWAFEFPHGTRHGNAVVEPATGKAHYDSDYSSSFPKFVDRYSIEAIKQQAELQGLATQEGVTADGEVYIEVIG